MAKLKVLDLFSGVGGFSLGLERTGGFETVAFCEIDPFCQKVLKKHWPDVPCFNDVRTLEYDGAVDVITGGFPCQPFSCAGRRGGANDDRHLWPVMFSLIDRHRPAWVIGENVAGFTSMGFEDCERVVESKTTRRQNDQDSFSSVQIRQEKMFLDDCGESLEKIGYQVQPFIIPACGIGAPHRRDRVWIVAWNAEGAGKAEERGICARESSLAVGVCQEDDTHANGAGCEERDPAAQPGWAGFSAGDARDTSIAGFPDWAGGEVGMPGPVTEFERPDGREIERDFRGVPHGVSNRVDRIRCLGNTVVPQIPEMLGHAILAAEEKS